MGWLKRRKLRKQLRKEFELYEAALKERVGEDSKVFHSHMKALRSLYKHLGMKKEK